MLHKVGFKPAALVGILVMSLGGAFPFLMPDITDYTYVIVSRGIVGIGLGIMFPVGNATIVAFTEGKRRSQLLGWGITIQFVFNLIYTTVAGYLTEIGWNYSFLAYLIGIVPCFFAQSSIVYACGVFLLGFGGSAFFTAAQNATGNIAPKSRILPFSNRSFNSDAYMLLA